MCMVERLTLTIFSRYCAEQLSHHCFAVRVSNVSMEDLCDQTEPNEFCSFLLSGLASA